MSYGIQGPIVAFFRAAGLVESEHARAVRVVKALKKAIQTPICDVDHGYILACDDILAALQRGRGKGGSDGTNTIISSVGLDTQPAT